MFTLPRRYTSVPRPNARVSRAGLVTSAPKSLLLSVFCLWAALMSPPAVAKLHAQVTGMSLGNVALALSAASPTPTPSPQPTPSIFTTNPSLNSLSVFPVGCNSNAASLFSATNLSSPQGVAYFSGRLYVANKQADSINIYLATANGPVSPIATITGSNTQLYDPVAVALDSSGKIYVANDGSVNGNADTITVYAAGSNGDVTPTAIINGPNTGLQLPSALALDSQNNIYASNYASQSGGTDSIVVFSAGANGNTSPARTLSGAATGLNAPAGVAVDSSGYLYATSYGISDSAVSVLVYAPGASGNAAPLTSIDGDCATLNSPGALTIANNKLYVTNPANSASGDESVAVYSNIPLVPSGPLCIPPTSLVYGPNTQLNQPFGIAADSSGNMFVTNSGSDSITVFPSTATTNTPPSAIIASSNGLLNPSAVAVDSTGSIYVANVGSDSGQSDRITVYSPGSNAKTAPIAFSFASASGDLTGLSYPSAIAVDASGKIYVANQTAGYQMRGSVTVYSGPASLWVPLWNISGTSSSDKTGLDTPTAIDLDTSGDIFVLNSNGGSSHSGSITVYAPISGLPGGPGNVAPIRTIKNGSSSALTKFDSPHGMALDSSNKIYVTNDGSIAGDLDSVTVYAAGANGNAAPIAVISGANTQLNLPQGIAIDSAGKIYVANNGSANGGTDAITVYAAGANGNAAPIQTIAGSLTGLNLPAGVAVGP